jgi:hypothetical protein
MTLDWLHPGAWREQTAELVLAGESVRSAALVQHGLLLRDFLAAVEEGVCGQGRSNSFHKIKGEGRYVQNAYLGPFHSASRLS